MSFIFNTFKRSISEQEKYSDTFLPETPDTQLKIENIGINKTSELAGWSSGHDMRELKSPLDTIRRTASELITGIEGQLRELQRDRELIQYAPRTDRAISGGSKKQSVLNALRERQARMKAQEKEKPGQEKQGQKAQAKKKGEPEL